MENGKDYKIFAKILYYTIVLLRVLRLINNYFFFLLSSFFKSVVKNIARKLITKVTQKPHKYIL